MQEKRRHFWIDRFQTYLFLRIGLYCALYHVAVWSVFYLWRHTHPTLVEMMGDAGGWLSSLLGGGSLLFLGFLFVYDAVLFAHRLVGPVYRFRKTIQAVTAGEEVDRVRLREGDFLTEMRDDLNELLQVLEQRGVVTLRPGGVEVNQKEPVSV